MAVMKNVTLEKLKKKLLVRRRQLLKDADNIRVNSLGRGDDASGDLSVMPIHMADLGSDTFQKEFAADILQNEEQELHEIDAALARLANGSFAVCEICGKRVSYERLSAVPYARLCVTCKRREEKESA